MNLIKEKKVLVLNMELLKNKAIEVTDIESGEQKIYLCQFVEEKYVQIKDKNGSQSTIYISSIFDEHLNPKGGCRIRVLQ